MSDEFQSAVMRDVLRNGATHLALDLGFQSAVMRDVLRNDTTVLDQKSCLFQSAVMRDVLRNAGGQYRIASSVSIRCHAGRAPEPDHG